METKSSLPQNLLPMHRAAPAIEAEGIAATARATGGQIQTQDMSVFGDAWGGNEQLWWIEAEPGDRLNLSIEAEEAGEYELVGFFTRGPDYGILRVHAGGEALRPLVDGYGPSVEQSGPVSFGVVVLEEGENDIVVELVGKDARAFGYSDGYLVGIDGFLLRRSDRQPHRQ